MVLEVAQVGTVRPTRRGIEEKEKMGRGRNLEMQQRKDHKDLEQSHSCESTYLGRRNLYPKV